jgi:methylenetetrahydrofolate dehydrogenase (NADP+)/methenyltetrahydrofolate cyclohydrolase
MIIDGKAIAASILDEVKQEVVKLEKPPHLTVFTCAPNFETKKFLALKQRKATEVGIEVTVVEFAQDVSTLEIMKKMAKEHPKCDGIIVQLPFPEHIEIKLILDMIAPSHDVDALQYNGTATAVLPPVVGAIDEITKRNSIDFNNKRVVVVGNGRLVGAPSAIFARSLNSLVTVVQKNTPEANSYIKTADILILGAGVPGLITADMVKEGVVIFDAGTSEEGGMLVGDAAPEVSSKASILTPVPGGVGPITIAVLLRNIVSLVKNQ